jgi:glucose-6-phosphate dehydrogenase assembly protein OpcA
LTTLWDTNGREVALTLAAERHNCGAITSGMALTLVCSVKEHEVEEAEHAATIAADNHPMRRLFVIRETGGASASRLDAEVIVGGPVGPGDVVELRMVGVLAAHADSVVVPLLAPDTPVVTWWHGVPPNRIGDDPLGGLAQRRITDVVRAPNPVAALYQRGQDFAPGDTDLAWTRITSWRAALASAYDAVTDAPVSAQVVGDEHDPSALLLAGWLAARLGFDVPVHGQAKELNQVILRLASGESIRASRTTTTFSVERPGRPTTMAPIRDRCLGELLTEELRRLDNDAVYAQALGKVCGLANLNERASRDHAGPARWTVSTS